MGLEAVGGGFILSAVTLSLLRSRDRRVSHSQRPLVTAGGEGCGI